MGLYGLVMYLLIIGLLPLYNSESWLNGTLWSIVMYLIGLLPLYNSESWLNETLWSSNVFNWFIASV